MSWIRLLPLVSDLIKDPVLGLAAKVEALESIVPTKVRSDFNLISWALRGDLRPTGKPNVMLRLGDADIEPDPVGMPQRDADVGLEIGFETFHSDLDVIQNEVSVYAGAVTWLMNDLRAFSDAQPVPRKIVVVGIKGKMRVEPVLTQGGTFNGFLATLTIQERSYD